jgi:hypothetical protein
LPLLGRIAARSTRTSRFGLRVGHTWPDRRLSVTKSCQIEQFAHTVFPGTCDELVAVTGGQPADVA